MMTTERQDQLLKRALDLSDDLNQKKGGDFFDELSLASLGKTIQDLQKPLEEDEVRRSSELVQLVFDDLESSHLHLPLRLLSDVADHFSKTLSSIAHHFVLHSGAPDSQPDKPSQPLELELAGTGPNSILISGHYDSENLNVDLFKESLDRTFAILVAESPQEILSSALDLGPQAMENLSLLLTDIYESRFLSTMIWEKPNGDRKEWRRPPEEIQELSDYLKTVEHTVGQIQVHTGTAITLSQRGIFELLADGGRLIQARLSPDKLNLVSAYHVGQRVQAQLLPEAMRSTATGDESHAYTLLTLEAIE